MTKLAIYFAIGMLGSAVLTPVCRLIAMRLGIVAAPQQDRWHKQATPLFGGVSIVVATLAAGLTISPTIDLWQLLGCGLLIAVFGFVDDVLSMKASTKLI